MLDKLYLDSYLVIGLSATATFFLGIFSFLIPGIYFKNDLHIQTITQGMAVIISAPLSYVLILNYEILGAGLSLALSHFILILLLYIWNIYKIKSYILLKFNWKKILLFLLFFLAMSTLFLIIRIESLNHNLIISFIAMLIVLLISIQFFTKKELARFKSILF